MIKPQVIIKSVQMDDPTFEGGVAKTATAQLSNPTAKQFTYEVELYMASDELGINKIATSGVGTVTIDAGGTAPTSFIITMPVIEAEYYVFLSVKVDGVSLVLYKATENVTVVISPDIEVGPIIWG